VSVTPRSRDRAAARAARLAELDIRYPPELPVSARRDDLLAAIRDHQVVVVAGETGSGKTTQLPKLCLELGRGVAGAIAHTQPRRLAARTVAARIAEELGVPLGQAVGYAVRFTDRTRDDTLVKLMTDGLLLAEIARDRQLRRYDTVIVDEAHERSLNVDFLLGYLQQLLPRRPDLKLVITSATIDPERFARHFGDAPVVEVSGRTYPVETRYRPLGIEPGDDRDLLDAIGDAVDELVREGPGDVLVFLSGEREVRDTAEALEGRFPDVEVLPLYARLSTGEQQRVFRPGPRRRVVLATNVAETSLTVPGIRYVVDPGTARISRYSPRLKVQRLPIEPVSQASADQRKGRCGRTAEGICIRLYAEEDFAARPRFTDPEVLRTSLASVVLQMAALDLGDVEAFPFLDPPDRRQVRDGVNLLVELGALDGDGRLTTLGRKLADLPVDPRLGRMVLEAGRRGCLEEVSVIAAALSIQDPRERPAEQRAQADQQHARFADEHGSDFLAFWNLWNHLGEQRQALSGNRFRKRCRAEFLNYLRVREWQDLTSQLRHAARGVGIERNRTPAEARDVHTALLSGLLSHVGLEDPGRREYVGARGARFALFPGSSLARRPPDWVMVAELVETSRLFGRTAARIDPRWVEPLAGHLVKRTYAEPRWQRRRAQVVATERVTLYGLPIVTGRTVGYGRIDPAASRELFIRGALVAGDWEAKHAFLEENRALLAALEAEEDRRRRRDLVPDDHWLAGFFDERIPREIASGAAFDRWWREERLREPDRLTLTRELLAADDAAAAGRPETWVQGELALPLTYRFEPGAEDDGVTAHVPLAALGQVRASDFEWLVPALRAELVTALLRGLPKELRRPLVPVPDTAARLAERIDPAQRALADVLAAELTRAGLRIGPEAFDLAGLPPHLRMRFQVEDGDGRVLGHGRDLDALRDELRPRLQDALTRSVASLEHRGVRAWPGGELPRVVELPGTGGAIRGYPALVDEGETAGVRVLETPEAQRDAMLAGTRRLLLLTVPSPVAWVRKRLPLAWAAAPRGLLDDVVAVTVDALVARHGGPAWDEAGFARLRAHVAGDLAEATLQVAGLVAAVLDAEADVRARLAATPFADARADVERQLDRLVGQGWVVRTGVRRLPHVERYLRAAAQRLERLPDRRAVDADRMRVVGELEALLDERARAGADVEELRWQLEELRVAQFAQGLGTRGEVSVKKLRRALAGG